MAKTSMLNIEKDRLSSLPDDILTKIICLLQINSAIATSVLSRRWRHLWTGLTSIIYDQQTPKRIAIKNILHLLSTGVLPEETSKKISFEQILPKLTSSKLHIFRVNLESDSSKHEITESCFREICRRDVEQISIFSTKYNGGVFFCVPAFVFRTRTLVKLELHTKLLMFDFPEDVDIQLPNLKVLSLGEFCNTPPWLETICKSCPILEYLGLIFRLYGPQLQQTLPFVNISAHNLKTLRVEKTSPFAEITKIIIDAPKLENLEILDQTLCHYFVQNPTFLEEALIDLSLITQFARMIVYSDEEQLKQMFNFVSGMFNVTKLQLHLEKHTNIFHYLASTNHEQLPIFHNLIHLETSFSQYGLNVWKNLLLSMQCFPNLTHLKVTVKVRLLDPPMNWDEPDFVAYCLVSKVRTITLYGVRESDNYLKLVAYILKNAIALEKLHICLDYLQRIYGSNFSESVFKLPKGSSNCEIKFINK